LVVLMDYVFMVERLHKLTPKIILKIFSNLERAKKTHTFDELAEFCNTSQENLVRIFNKRRGKNPERFTLNMALKLWEGLGHPPETLIADCNVEPLLAAKIKRIQASDYNHALQLFLEVFADWEYANPQELAKVEGYLEAIRDRIIEARDRPPAAPGESLSNSAVGDE